MRKYVPNVRAYNIYFYYWHGFNIFNPMDRQQQRRQRPSFLYAFVHGTKYKTFTHFKIVYNFISFEVSLAVSLLAFASCNRHIVSRVESSRSICDFSLFLENSHFHRECVLSTLAFVAFRLIFVVVVVGVVVVLSSSPRRHLAATVFELVYI